MISQEEIKTFLEGNDPEEHIVSIEFDYLEGSVYKIKEPPGQPKTIQRDTFIAFENLTREQVEAWIYATISEEKLQIMKDDIKNKLIDETSLTVRPPPWLVLNPPNPPEDPIVK
jgi:hypothetical protein